jgi:hypothetical protein
MRPTVDGEIVGPADETRFWKTASAATKSAPNTSTSGAPIASPRAIAAVLSERTRRRTSCQRTSVISSGIEPTAAAQAAATRPPP